MTYMQWSEDLETGIQVIDDQHKRIVQYINELDHAIRTGDRNEVNRVIEGLLDYTITHFEFEEELQRRAEYPFLKAHQRVHEIFIRKLSSLRERFDNGENVSGELLSMLKVWLSSHIKGDDQDYVESVSNMLGAENSQRDAHDSWIKSTVKRLFG